VATILVISLIKKLTKLAHFAQFKRVFTFCLWYWGAGPLAYPLAKLMFANRRRRVSQVADWCRSRAEVRSSSHRL